MEEREEQCREKIVSEDYADFIWQTNVREEDIREIYPDVCVQRINDYYTVFYADRNKWTADRERLYEYGYELFPTLYTPLQSESLEASGILALQNQPVLNLRGQGVLLGFVDTGIDYRNRCFLDAAGKSRILTIWDQIDQSGTPPEGIGYGSVYTREQINEALASALPYEIVPSLDSSGHGTRLASIAGGSENLENSFVGAAPLASIAMVRLKPAKSYLKEYFLVSPEAEAYQENDVMLGVRFLEELAQREGLPLVICLAIGSNMGGHTGTSPLSSYLNAIGARAGRCIVIAGGNEANQGHHYYGVMREQEPYQDVELRVDERETGLMMELWSNTPDVFSVSVTSPSGEEVPRVTSAQKNWMFDFLFEKTVIYVNVQSLDPFSGEQLIAIRMADPSPGIWRIRVFGERVVDGVYNLWLPVTGFISAQTEFLNSNPDITLTEPSNTETPITVGAYRAENGSLYMDSGRGFTRNGRIKPDLAAPGVNVTAYGPDNRETAVTGTSAAAALTAGGAALLLEWGVGRGNRLTMGTLEIKQLLIRGADRSPSLLYPNRSWGYGTLNLYQAFMALGRF